MAASRTPRPSERESFDANWERDDNDCWVWAAGRFTSGYGSFRGKYAHRAVVELYVGPIPTGREVHHTCGVRACVNPAHLEVVTPAAHHERHVLAFCRRGHNLAGDGRDRFGRCRVCHRERQYARQRKAGEAAREARNERIRTIRSRARAGESIQALASEFGVHPTTVKRYRDGETRTSVL